MTGSARRATLRSVVMPVEHGGWGLTLEPALLGVLPRPARVLGLRQMILGFGVVGATAVGTWLL
jgi:hypothetical protein